MAYIRKLSTGWRAEIQRHGQRLSKVLPSKREAQQWALENEAKANSLAAGWRTFTETARKYELEVTEAKRGKKWERARLGVMVDHFDGKRLAEIDAPDIAAWRDWRLKTVQPSTVLREANLLRHVFSKARDEWRWMSNDPFRGVKMPADAQPRAVRWGWRQIRRVLRHAQGGGPKSQEVGQAFHIALRTGMRLQEVLAAPQGFIEARRVVMLDQTKTGAAVVPVGRIAAKLLVRPAFTVTPNEASVLFSKLCRQLMITGLTFHDARATALTHLAKKVPVEVLAKISRHRDISLLVRTYYRPTPDEVARMI